MKKYRVTNKIKFVRKETLTRQNQSGPLLVIVKRNNRDAS